MHKTISIAAALGLMLAVGPAYADDEADCLKGIAKLKAVKKPTTAPPSWLAERGGALKAPRGERRPRDKLVSRYSKSSGAMGWESNPLLNLV
jgi:hypothetical protein